MKEIDFTGYKTVIPFNRGVHVPSFYVDGDTAYIEEGELKSQIYREPHKLLYFLNETHYLDFYNEQPLDVINSFEEKRPHYVQKVVYDLASQITEANLEELDNYYKTTPGYSRRVEKQFFPLSQLPKYVEYVEKQGIWISFDEKHFIDKQQHEQALSALNEFRAIALDNLRKMCESTGGLWQDVCGLYRVGKTHGVVMQVSSLQSAPWFYAKRMLPEDCLIELAHLDPGEDVKKHEELMLSHLSQLAKLVPSNVAFRGVINCQVERVPIFDQSLEHFDLERWSFEPLE